MASFVVVLDANVLYGIEVTGTKDPRRDNRLALALPA